MRKFLAIAAALLAVVSFVPAASAAFKVDITSLGTNTITDNGAGDNNPLLGIISANVLNNGYNVSVNATFGQDANGGFVSDQTISVDTFGSGAVAIIIDTSYDGFTFAPVGTTVNATSSISTTKLNGGNTASVVSTVDGTTSAPVVLLGPTNSASQSLEFSDLIGTNPFTVLNRIRIDGLTAFQSVNVTGTTTVVIPEPTSVAIWLGMSLLGLSVVRSRKNG